jgi:hypothetical protein
LHPLICITFVTGYALHVLREYLCGKKVLEVETLYFGKAARGIQLERNALRETKNIVIKIKSYKTNKRSR